MQFPADDGPPFAGEAGDFGDRESPVPVGLGQMLGHLALQTEVLH